MAAPDFTPIALERMALNAWNEVLKEHVQSKTGRSRGHHFLYINSQKDIALFSGKAEAKSLGFSKLSLEQIINVTNNKVLECKEIRDLYQAENLIKPLIYRKVVKINSTFSTLPSNSKKQEKLTEEKVRQTQQLQRIQQIKVALEKNCNPLTNIISPEMYTNLEKELSETINITRSNQGSTGVYYLTTPHNRVHLLKLRGNPLPHVLADRFLRTFGFITCEYACLNSKTELGQLVHSKVEQYVRPHLQQALQNAQTDEDKRKYRLRLTQLTDQQNVSYITVMKYVKGLTFSEIGMEDIKMVFTSSKCLETLGEMIFLDCLILNSDRLGSVICNPGNFLLNKNADKPIILIDHDYNVNNTNYTTLEKDVGLLLNSKTHKKSVKMLTDKFLQNMKGGRDQKFFKDLLKNKEARQFIHTSLSKGIRQAAENFVKKFSQEPHLIYEILDVPSSIEEHYDLPNPTLLFNILEVVKKYVK